MFILLLQNLLKVFLLKCILQNVFLLKSVLLKQILLNVYSTEQILLNVFLLKSHSTENFSTFDWVTPYPLDCSKLYFWSQINFIFFLSMCLGKTRPHAKFQVSSLNILSWRPVFVIEIQ